MSQAIELKAFTRIWDNESRTLKEEPVDTHDQNEIRFRIPRPGWSDSELSLKIKDDGTVEIYVTEGSFAIQQPAINSLKLWML